MILYRYNHILTKNYTGNKSVFNFSASSFIEIISSVWMLYGYKYMDECFEIIG